MNLKEKQESWRESSFSVPATPPHSPAHRPRSEELWASPQRLRYLRSLSLDNHCSPQ